MVVGFHTCVGWKIFFQTHQEPSHLVLGHQLASRLAVCGSRRDRGVATVHKVCPAPQHYRSLLLFPTANICGSGGDCSDMGCCSGNRISACGGHKRRLLIISTIMK